MPGNLMSGVIPKKTDGKRVVSGDTLLSSGGYHGEVPDFPLEDPTRREMQLWNDHWTLPQAQMWAKMHVIFLVARYIRSLALIEHVETISMPTTNLHSEVRQLEDRLGLSPLSLIRLRWKFVDEETGQVVDAKDAAKASVHRLRAVDHKAAGS